MIDRLKFRGKLSVIKDGKPDSIWFSSDDFPDELIQDRLYRFFGKVAVREIDPATVGQWTGLVDKNGVEIYEGDKLGGVHADCYIKYCDTCKGFVVATLPGLGDTCLACEGDLHWYEVAVDSFLEVIGNIHEAKS